MPRICIIPEVNGLAGVASFRLKFEDGLRLRGVDVTHDPSEPADAILVLAGTKDLIPLWKAHRRRARIVQRLDGINWVHRARWAGFRYTVRAIYGNANLSLIRARFASHVIYQSQFIRRWWENWYGPASIPFSVILNGVDLTGYTPKGLHERPTQHIRLLVVEGSLAGGLDSGLHHAIHLANTLSKKLRIELWIVGRVDFHTQNKMKHQTAFRIKFLNTVPREHIPWLMRSSHLLFSAEVNPPCPNSVIEALACGLPVIGFDTGSLSEIVEGDTGCIVPYEGDPWKLEKPDISSLANAAIGILEDQTRFRTSARERAETVFGLDKMVDQYLEVLLG